VHLGRHSIYVGPAYARIPTMHIQLRQTSRVKSPPVGRADLATTLNPAYNSEPSSLNSASYIELYKGLL